VYTAQAVFSYSGSSLPNLAESERKHMTGTYRAVMLTEKGGPEVLRIVDLPIELPAPGQLRVRMHAAGVGATDLSMLAGNYRRARS
jgi:hypothetical protein